MGTSVDQRLGIRHCRAVSSCAGSDRDTAVAEAEGSSDAALVEAARSGDRGAFGELYRRYARMVHGILLAHVPWGDAEDLVHDVFLLALRRIHALRECGAFGGWLASITRNRAMDYHRRSPGEERHDTARLSEDPAVEDPPRAEALAVLAVIRRLPEAYRETLAMRLVEGLTGPEIAARTGLTPASVRVNLHRGMKQLREMLGPRNDSHE